MSTRQIPTQEEILGYMKSLSNWGRWGPDDELGTLNLITPQKMAQASSLVKEGISVSCARPIEAELTSDVASIPPLHYMMGTGEAAPEKGAGGASDFIGFAYHGYTITHLDSLCHMFWDQKMYNGKPASMVGVQKKASALGVQNAKGGFVTRGVLLDIAKLKGVPWMEAGDPIFSEDLNAAEEAQGVKVTEGDALLIRTGWYKKRLEVGPPPDAHRPGLHGETLPWLHERGVSTILADASQDVSPSDYPALGLPVHRVSIPFMGLWLIDAGNCEEVVEVCERLNRWEFMFVMAPIRFNNATGCPVNPLAVF